MTRAGIAPWVVLCAGLSCLFLVSTVALVVLLVRRGRAGKG